MSNERLATVETKVERLEAVSKDHEDRLRYGEKKLFMLIGGGFTIQILIAIALHFIK